MIRIRVLFFSLFIGLLSCVAMGILVGGEVVKNFTLIMGSIAILSGVLAVAVFGGKGKAEEEAQVPGCDICRNLGHLAIALTLAIYAGMSWWTALDVHCAFFAVAFADLYFIAILIEAAARSGKKRTVKVTWLFEKKKQEKWELEIQGAIEPKPAWKLRYPNRSWSLLMVPLMVFTVISGFAAVFENSRHIMGSNVSEVQGRMDAIYYSMVTVTTLGDGNMAPNGLWAKFYVMWELISGLLLFFCIFPFLITRVSDF